MGEISKIGDICAPWTEFPMDLDQTKVTQSIYEVFLRLYQRAEALGSRVGHWCTEMQSPPVSYLLKMGHICAPGNQFPMDFGQTKDAESKDNIFLRLYQRGEALGSKVGRWCTEMQSPGGLNFENGRDLCTTEPIHHGFGSNEGCRVHL